MTDHRIPGIARRLGLRLAGPLAVFALVGLPSAVAAAQDRAFVVEISRADAHASFSSTCQVWDGLGGARESVVAGHGSLSLRFLGTALSCRVDGHQPGALSVVVREGGSVLVAVAAEPERPSLNVLIKENGR